MSVVKYCESHYVTVLNLYEPKVTNRWFTCSLRNKTLTFTSWDKLKKAHMYNVYSINSICDNVSDMLWVKMDFRSK